MSTTLVTSRLDKVLILEGDSYHISNFCQAFIQNHIRFCTNILPCTNILNIKIDVIRTRVLSNNFLNI